MHLYFFLFLLTSVAPEVVRKVAAMKVPRLLRPIFKGFAVLVIFGVLGTALVLGSLWLEHRGEVTLPTPTGPFAVGRAVYDWADDGAVDTLRGGAGADWFWAKVGIDLLPDRLAGEAAN